MRAVLSGYFEEQRKADKAKQLALACLRRISKQENSHCTCCFLQGLGLFSSYQLDNTLQGGFPVSVGLNLVGSAE